MYEMQKIQSVVTKKGGTKTPSGREKRTPHSLHGGLAKMIDTVVGRDLPSLCFNNRVGEEDRHHVHSFNNAYTADDDASRSGRENLPTGCCNPLSTWGAP